MGTSEFIHRRSLLRFFDGLAWLMQIVMFLTLGQLVFPSRLVCVADRGLLILAILMLVARRLGVVVSLAPIRLRPADKVFVAWVGLRGAAPTVLAFFVFLTSVLLQDPSIPLVARWLGVDAPMRPMRGDPI